MWKFLLQKVQQHDSNNYLSKNQMYADNEEKIAKKKQK